MAFGTKYQGKYIKSGKEFRVDIEAAVIFGTPEAAKTAIVNRGSTSVIDNGTDFDVTGAVGFSFTPSLSNKGLN